MLRMFITALAIAVAAPAVAGPNAQLLKQIEIGLVGTGIRTDVSKLTTPQAAAIFFELRSPEETHFGGLSLSSRDKILSILRWNPETDPERLQ